MIGRHLQLSFWAGQPKVRRNDDDYDWGKGGGGIIPLLLLLPSLHPLNPSCLLDYIKQSANEEGGGIFFGRKIGWTKDERKGRGKKIGGNGSRGKDI